MNRFPVQVLLLFFSFFGVFLWQKTSTQEYTSVLLGIITLFYLFFTFKKTQAPLRVILLNTCVLLLIFATGGMQSILFFLLYFLSFSIGFLLIPETVFVFGLLVILLFLPESLQGNFVPEVVKLLSFLLICPLAYVFGKEVNTHEKMESILTTREAKTHEAAEQIVEDVSDIVKAENTPLKEEQIERLRDIVTQSRKLENGENNENIK